MTVSDLFAWNSPQFKADQPSRFDTKKAKATADDANWRAVCQQVNERDEHRCRVCGRFCNPRAISLLKKGHHHHIVYRSAQGDDTTSNICLLCADCHDQVHLKKALRIDGNADEALTFWRVDAEGAWYLSRREIAVGRVEKD